MSEKIVSTGEPVFDARQLRQALEDKAAADLRRETEIEVFDEPGIDFREYRRRVDLYHGKGAESYFIDNEKPQDEMDYRDYRLSRGDVR